MFVATVYTFLDNSGQIIFTVHVTVGHKVPLFYSLGLAVLHIALIQSLCPTPFITVFMRSLTKISLDSIFSNLI
uniref:Uncharacterized protein n=1 Tax=Anguilla anguilla TaxID=7936 RepID=A0A0E9PVI9_ANGAN